MNTCAHSSCSCLVEPEEMYRSDHCAERRETAGVHDDCRCGHADCLADRDVRAEDEELTEPPEELV